MMVAPLKKIKAKILPGVILAKGIFIMNMWI